MKKKVFFILRETAGEEDHPTYNLHILKKPIYAISNGNMTPNNDRLGMINPNKYICFFNNILKVIMVL